MNQVTKEKAKLNKKQRSQHRISNESVKGETKASADKGFLTSNAMVNGLRTIILGLLMAAIFYPPYLRGLYFERDQLPAEAITLGIFCLYWIYKFIKKDGKFLETPIDYASFGLMAVYFVVIIFAVGLKLAVLEWLKYCMYFAVFFMLSELITSYRSKVLVIWTMISSALGVCILGIDAAAGGRLVLAANRIIAQIFNLDHDLFFSLFNDNRLYSTLQYPNALASYLMAVFFVTLGIMAVSSKLWVKALTGGMNAVLLISFILTQSRGAYVMLPVAGLIYIAALPFGKRVQGTAYFLSSLIPSLVVSAIVIGYAANPAAPKTVVWSLVVVGMLVSGAFTVITSYFMKWLEMVSWKAYAAIAALGVTILTVGAVYVINTAVPLVLNQPGVVIKSTALKPEQEYKLVYNVNAVSASEAKIPYVYYIIIKSKNEKEIILNKSTTITTFEGHTTEGNEKRELTFKVPSDSKIVRISFGSDFKNTKTWLDNAVIVRADTGEVEDKLILNYKYLPDSVASRLEDIIATNSGLVRETYYKDGYKIFKDRWLLGAGGGAWSLLYFQHQAYAYPTTQAHNYFLQVAVETGLVGLITLILLLTAIAAMYLLEFRYRKENDDKERTLQAAIFTGIVAMFMHSAIDFDLSLSAVYLFLWQLIGIFNSRYRNNNATVYMIEYKSNLIGLFFEKLAKIFSLLGKPRLNIYPVLGIVISILVVLLPISFASAKGYALKSGEAVKSNNIPEAVKNMKIALSKDPLNPIYMVDYANMLVGGKSVSQENLQEANKAIDKAEKISKFNFFSDEVATMEVLPLIAQYYFKTNEVEKGLGVVNRNIALRPLWPEKWQDKLNAYFAVIMYHFGKDEPEEALVRIDQALGMIDEAIEVNKDNMDPFIFNNDTQEILERLKYINDYLTRKSEIDLDRLVFYSIPDMDVNSDGIPDQWTAVGNTKIRYERNSVVAESTVPDQAGIIKTRNLTFQPGKQYRVELEPINPQSVSTLTYFISGISKSNLNMETEGNTLVGEFTVPSDFKAGANPLMLFIPGNLEFKFMRIIER